nr:transcriptional regulator ATRX homolog [Lytechinus pictus]
MCLSKVVFPLAVIGVKLAYDESMTVVLWQLHGLHDHYQQMKQNMGFQDNLSMKLVRESMADYIIQRVHGYQASDDDEDDSEQEREANPAQERAARIAMIKNKSFTTKGQGTSSQRHLQEAATSTSEMDEKPSLSPDKPGRRGRKRMKKTRGRKRMERDRPATEIEKKKAWSILPMRRLIDVDEEKEEDRDEDSDSEQDRKKRKSPQKSATNKGVKGKKISQKKEDKGKDKKMKKTKKKKKKRRKSETDGSTGETSWDDKSEVTGSATSATEDTESSPRKRRGQKRKRGLSPSGAESSDGRKKGSVSDSDGQKDGWFESDRDELGTSPIKGKSPNKGKSPIGQTSQISFYDSDDAVTGARSEDEEFTSLKRKRRGRPKKSVMPEDDIWSKLGNMNRHQDGWVSDGGPSSGVRVDFSRDGSEAVKRTPPKKILLGVKKTPRKDSPMQESGKGLTVQDGKGLEKPQEEKRKRGRKPKGAVERSPRKSSRPRKVVKYET